MGLFSTAMNDRRSAWRWPGGPAFVLALALVVAVANLALNEPVEAAPRIAAGAAATEIYRPGGMALGDTERALGHDPRAVAGCLLAGDREFAGPGVDPRRRELSTLFTIIGASATGREVLARARRHGVHVCIDSETDLLAYYFAGRHMAGVRAALSQGGKIAFLAHELAHVPQHPTYSDNRYYPPADLILLRRVREATAEAVAIRIAWELREAGHGAAWDAKMATAYADMARRFAAAADTGDAADLTKPTRAAFDHWFEAPWRRNTYDRMTLAHLGRIAADRIGLVPPRYTLSDDFLAAIAWMAGRNFLLETGARALTGSAYGGRLSDDNARSLARFNVGASLSASPFRTQPIAAVSP